MASRPLKPTDLVEAAKRGDCETALAALKVYPTQVDVQLSGKTALQEAAFRGYLDFILILLRENADLYCDDIDMSTPLHYAVKGNKPDAVLLLLKSDRTQKLIHEKDINGCTAPQLAFDLKHKESVRVFMDWDKNVQLKKVSPRRRAEVFDFNTVMVADKVENQIKTNQSDENPIEKAKDDKPSNDEPPVDKCYFCKENAAAITFSPCGCELSCFECSLSTVACGCGTPIERRCYNENNQLKKFIEEVKRNRRLLQKSTDEIKTLRGYMTCSICTDLPIMCMLECGHMFCVPCVKKIKFRDRTMNAKCPHCRRPSRYTVLRTEWPTAT